MSVMTQCDRFLKKPEKWQHGRCWKKVVKVAIAEEYTDNTNIMEEVNWKLWWWKKYMWDGYPYTFHIIKIFN